MYVSGARVEHSLHRPRLTLYILLLVILLGFGVRIFALDKPSLWLDETLSMDRVDRATSIQGLAEILTYEDLHPPLFFLALYGSDAVAGRSEFSVRFLSVVLGILLVPITYAITRELLNGSPGARRAGTIVGLTATALVAFSPFLVRYSREARGYMMSALLVALATLALLRASRLGGRWWATYALLGALSWYTHYFAIFTMPAFALYSVLMGWRVLRRWLGATALSIVLFLPWVRPMALQLNRLISAPDFFPGQSDPLKIVEGVAQILLPGSGGLLAVAGAVAAVIVFVAGAAALMRQGSVVKRVALIFLVWIAPVTLTAAVVTFIPKFTPRYVITAATPLIISLTLVLFMLLWRWRPIGRAIYTAAVIIAILQSFGQTAMAAARGELAEGDDPRALAQFLKAQTRPDDVLLLIEDAPQVFRYYDPGPAKVVGAHIGADLAAGAQALNQALAQRPPRIWLVLWHENWADPSDFALTELVRRGRIMTATDRFAGYKVWGFEMLDYRPVALQPQPETLLDADFGEVASVVGYDLIDHDPGALHVITYWRRLNPGAGPYVATLALEDEQGYRYISATQPLATWHYGPDRWSPDQIVRVRLDMPLPPDLPPRSYRAWLLLWDAQANALVTVSRATSPARTRRVQLADIPLAKAQVGGAPLRVPHPANDPFPAGLHLLGYDLDRAHALPGDRLILALWWRAGDQGIRPEKLKLRLLAADGQVGYLDEQPVLSGYPPVSWQPGEVNRAIYTIALPVELGRRDVTYALQVGLDEVWATLTEISVPSLNRHFELPAAAQPLDVAFGDLARLVGYSLQPAGLTWGQPLTVTLYWRPEARTNESYHVTAQLLVEGEKMAQHDGPPAQGKRPTTSWLPGEVVADVHPIMVPPDLPAGRYEILVALYQGDERLPIGPDRDFVLLPVSP